jgi:hypothetical protein
MVTKGWDASKLQACHNSTRSGSYDYSLQDPPEKVKMMIYCSGADGEKIEWLGDMCLLACSSIPMFFKHVTFQHLPSASFSRFFAASIIESQYRGLR